MMAITFERSGPAPDNLKYVARCDAPGCNQYATRGFGVRLREAIERKDGRLAGRWLCREHASILNEKGPGE